jgi:hypothetical protein
MTTKESTSDSELRRFQKLANLLKKTPEWNKSPECATYIEHLCTDASKEAQAVRDIMWRMADAELSYAKRLRQDS